MTRLLEDTYVPSKTFIYRVPKDLQQLIYWHSILETDTLKQGIRQSVVIATSMVTHEEHRFPHHLCVEYFLGKLVSITIRLAQTLDEKSYSNPIDRMQDAFALSAFVHFHLQDIHPFLTKNRQLGNFLSKHILDTVLPSPFPMGFSHFTYVTSLEDGRKESTYRPLQSPSSLCGLMIRRAEVYYRDMLDIYSDFVETKYFFAAESEESLLEQTSRKEIPDELCLRILEAWKTIESSKEEPKVELMLEDGSKCVILRDFSEV
jgi:hypothetical protein